MKDQIEEISLQLLRNLSSFEKKARKTFRLERDLNQRPLRCRFESGLSLNFFQAFFSQLLKLRSNCEDLSSINVGGNGRKLTNLPH